MNSLSWMMYLADLTGSVSGLCGVIGSLLLIGGSVAFVLGHTTYAGCAGPGYSWESREDREATHLAVGNALRLKSVSALKVGLAAILIATIIPSKETVYAIAASEAGERALTSPTGDKAIKALNAWLDRQITPSTKAEPQ